MSIGYPIHYYLPVLHHAQQCLDELSQHHNFGGNLKETKATPLSYGRVAIPSETIEVFGVFGVVGGERKLFALNQNLTLFQKLDGVTPVRWLEEDDTLPEHNSTGSSALLEQTAPYEIPTVYYPSDEVVYEYNIDYTNSQIVFGPRVEVTEVYLWYLSNGVSGTAANLVHPYAVETIHAYIDWKLSESERRAQSETMRKESSYFNQKRLLKGKMNPLSLSQLYHILITG
jgi:hypothetical protein